MTGGAPVIPAMTQDDVDIKQPTATKGEAPAGIHGVPRSTARMRTVPGDRRSVAPELICPERDEDKCTKICLRTCPKQTADTSHAWFGWPLAWSIDILQTCMPDGTNTKPAAKSAVQYSRLTRHGSDPDLVAVSASERVILELVLPVGTYDSILTCWTVTIASICVGTGVALIWVLRVGFDMLCLYKKRHTTMAGTGAHTRGASTSPPGVAATANKHVVSAKDDDQDASLSAYMTPPASRYWQDRHRRPRRIVDTTDQREVRLHENEPKYGREDVRPRYRDDMNRESEDNTRNTRDDPASPHVHPSCDVRYEKITEMADVGPKNNARSVHHRRVNRNITRDQTSSTSMLHQAGYDSTAPRQSTTRTPRTDIGLSTPGGKMRPDNHWSQPHRTKWPACNNNENETPDIEHMRKQRPRPQRSADDHTVVSCDYNPGDSGATTTRPRHAPAAEWEHATGNTIPTTLGLHATQRLVLSTPPEQGHDERVYDNDHVRQTSTVKTDQASESLATPQGTRVCHRDICEYDHQHTDNVGVSPHVSTSQQYGLHHIENDHQHCVRSRSDTTLKHTAHRSVVDHGASQDATTEYAWTRVGPSSDRLAGGSLKRGEATDLPVPEWRTGAAQIKSSPNKHIDFSRDAIEYAAEQPLVLTSTTTHMQYEVPRHDQHGKRVIERGHDIRASKSSHSVYNKQLTSAVTQQATLDEFDHDELNFTTSIQSDSAGVSRYNGVFQSNAV